MTKIRTTEAFESSRPGLLRESRVLIASVTLAVSLFALPTFATTLPSVNTNNITTTVAGSCKWVTPLTMAFGNYDPFAGAATTQSTTLNFKCVKLTAAGNTYKVWFSKTGGNMLNGAFTLAYTLTDAGSTPLPITAGYAVTVAGVPGLAGAGYSYLVKGSIAAGQDATAGAYADTVVSNIEY
jgi:spore coat protein U-like protein